MRPVQPVLSPITEAAIFLVMTIEDGAEADLREALTDVSALKRSVGFRIPEGELSCVVGLGASCWDRLFGSPRPAGLHALPVISGARHAAVSTPGDLLFHIRAHRFDLCFELAQRLAERLAGAARVVDEVHGFRSFDERDLLGFVDGTENPEGEAAADAVLIGAEDERFAGGSYAVVQKYLHDIPAWNALSVEEQQRVIGRTKLDDVELPDEAKPTSSHVALNTILDDDGREHQIVRLNMPFGNVGAGEIGTYFIGYSRRSELIELMLQNMFVGRPPGNYDRILDFSTAVTGSLFFVPSASFLDDLGGASTSVPDGASTSAPGGASTSVPGGASTSVPGGASTSVPGGEQPGEEGLVSPDEDGSLGIGGLGSAS
jgi:porphyrinogen peroxidase